MTTEAHQPQGAHLVGSVPLENADRVFRMAMSRLGGHLRRLPDGETGHRINWINCQYPLFAKNPNLETVPVPPNRYPPIPQVKIRDGVDPKNIEMPRLGYSDAAIAAYQEFARLKSAGVIPARMRFQVCLPTPLAPIHVFVTPDSQAALEPIYEARLLGELEEITRAIPANELAIQWDTAVEFALLEKVWTTRYADVESEILQRLVRLGNRVPASVELGYHLCYGDSQHKHFIEPKDAGNLVKVANGIAAGLDRTLNWLHLPILRNWTSTSHFEPLRDLKLRPETELYLGLVHKTDGIEGTRQRIDCARRVVKKFGIGTECGLGRRPPETVPELMDIHAATASPVA